MKTFKFAAITFVAITHSFGALAQDTSPVPDDVCYFYGGPNYTGPRHTLHSGDLVYYKASLLDTIKEFLPDYAGKPNRYFLVPSDNAAAGLKSARAGGTCTIEYVMDAATQTTPMVCALSGDTPDLNFSDFTDGAGVLNSVWCACSAP